MPRIEKQDRRAIREAEHQRNPRHIGHQRVHRRNRVPIGEPPSSRLGLANPKDLVAVHLFRRRQSLKIQPQPTEKPAAIFHDVHLIVADMQREIHRIIGCFAHASEARGYGVNHQILRKNRECPVLLRPILIPMQFKSHSSPHQLQTPQRRHPSKQGTVFSIRPARCHSSYRYSFFMPISRTSQGRISRSPYSR